MPQAVVGAAIATGSAIAFNSIPVGWTVTQFFFANVAISAVAGAVGKALANDGGNAPQMRGRSVMFRSPVAPHQVVYGLGYVSGPIVYAASSGADNRYLHLVIPLAGHEIEAIDEVYFNDEPASELDGHAKQHAVRLEYVGGDPISVTLDGVLFSAATPADLAAAIDADPKYTANFEDASFEGFQQYVFVHRVVAGVEMSISGARVKTLEQPFAAYRIKKHLGAADQAADPDLVAEVAEWTSAHRLRGIAYIYVRLTWDPDVWPNGIPNIKARVRGKKVFDPRTSLTAWSRNWALCVNDYLRDPNGFNCAASEIDSAELINAANIADEQVEYQPGFFHNRYEVSGAFTLDRAPLEVLSDLVSAGAGASVYQMGQWHIHAGAATTPEVVGLDIDTLRGPIRFQSHHKRQSLFNAVRGTYINRSDFAQPTDFPPVTNAAYQSEDGGEQIFVDIELPFTDNVYSAQRLATARLVEHRNATVIEWPAKITGLRYRVWDVVPVTVAALGWTNKLFRVIDFNLGGPGGPDLVLQAYDANTWAHDVNSVAAYVPPPVSSLPSPRTVQAPTDLVLYSGTDQLLQGGDGTIISRILADWHTRDGFARHDEVQYRRSTDTEWTSAGQTDAQQLLIGPVSDGVDYDVRVRTVNTLGVKSAWLQLINHTVIGKTAPPAAPTGLTITELDDGTRRLAVTANVPLDSAGYMYRARAGVHATWAALSAASGGVELTLTPVAQNPFETGQLPAGSYTIGVIQVDTTGNESTAYINQYTLGLNTAEITAAIFADPRVVNNLEDSGVVHITRPGGASLSLSGNPITGAIVIVLPQSWNSTMMKMDVEVFNYSSVEKSFTLKLGGYNWTGTGGNAQWVHEFAQLIGSIASDNRVRFGHNGSKCVIVIGDDTSEWIHPNVSVRNFVAGWPGRAVDNWNDGWDIIIETDTTTGYTYTGDFSDALVDAKSILGQGVLATSTLIEDEVTNTAITINPDGTLTGAGGGAVDALQILNGPAQAGADVTDYAFLAADAQVKADAAAEAARVLAETNAAAYADGEITVAEANAIAVAAADATAKADAAEAAASLVATWSGVTGAGKPADNADVTNYDDTRVANSISENGVASIRFPIGARYSYNNGNITGAIVIVLPQSWNNTMMKMAIDVFNYASPATSFTLTVGGYNYVGNPTPSWVNEFAHLAGSIANDNRVRFGHNGTKCVIVIGEESSVWSFPKISVRDFVGGFSGGTLGNWDDGWSITISSNVTTGYIYTGDFANALLDAHSIAGQGVLATSGLTEGQVTNTAITINANGTLTGAGGGQVNALSIPNGPAEANATNGATIGTNLSGSFNQTTWNAVMNAALINSAHISELSANKITTGTLTGQTLTGGTIQTAASPNKRVVLNGATNQAEFYNAANALIASIGLTASGADDIIGLFGSPSINAIPIWAESSAEPAVVAISGSNHGLMAQTTSDVAVAGDFVNTLGGNGGPLLRLWSFATNYLPLGWSTSGTPNWDPTHTPFKGHVATDAGHKRFFVGGTDSKWHEFMIGDGGLQASTGYVRFSNGFQICWGGDVRNASAPYSLTFANAFTSVYICLGIMHITNGTRATFMASGVSTTAITFTPTQFGNWNSGYIAIGYSA